MSEPGLPIVFNEISAREIPSLPTLQQLESLSEFRVYSERPRKPETTNVSASWSARTFFIPLPVQRPPDFFSVEELKVLVHRVLHKNSFRDFLYRGGMKVRDEDEALSDAGGIWELIDEGENSRLD